MERLTKVVGDRIRELRKAEGLTQEQLSERTSLSSSYLGEIERGKTNITIENLEKIIIALNVTPIYFFQVPFEESQNQMERRKAIEKIFKVFGQRSNEEIERLLKINKEIISAIDSKNEI